MPEGRPPLPAELVTVPRLAGMMINSATAKATMAAAQGTSSLAFEIVHQTTQIAPAGMVFIELPVFGSQVPAGSTVTLVVSDGPPPGQIHPPQPYPLV